MMKRIIMKRFTICIKFIIVLVLVCFSASVFAYDFEVDGICYNKISENEVAVTHYGHASITPRKYVGELIIPESVTYNNNSFLVSAIGEWTFNGCTGLTSIKIPNSVTTIGQSAFALCVGLTSIEIPNHVTNIGSGAFYGCTGLTSIEIPNSVTSIEDNAFEGCTGLESVLILCNNVSSCFRGMSIKKVVLGDKVISIGECAFYGCASLTSIEIPNSVTTIGSNAFEGCASLTSIEIPNSVTTIGGRAFSGCKGLKSIEIPNSMTSIEASAFEGCTGLTSIEISNSVTSIGANAFYGCTGLTGTLSLPNSITSIGQYSFCGCSMQSIVIPNSVTSIGKGAFYNNQQLTSVKSEIRLPFDISTDVFQGISSAILQVPKGTQQLYQAYTGWTKYFKEIVEYTIDYNLILSAIGKGSITFNGKTIRGNSSSFTVTEGDDAEITITPDEGNRIKSVKLNGTDVTYKVANNQYMIENITADITLEVEFEIITYSLSIKSTGNGVVVYNASKIRGKTSSSSVNYGTSAILTFTPDEGYRIKKLMVNSVDVTSNIKDGKYTISSVTSNTTVEVVFEAIPNYSVNILAKGNGNVGYEGTVIRNQSQSFSVREGASITLSFTPDKGYRVASVKVNKTDMTGQVVDGQLTISNISSNTSIEVEFEAIPPTTYTLTVKVGDNGSVTYDGTPIRNKSNTFTVVEGTYVTITLTPDEGYCVKSVKLNNEDVTSSVKNNQYTINSIGANTSLEVEFEELICTLSIKSSGNGSVTYDETAIRGKTSTFTVLYGTEAVVSFTPDEGYRIKSVKVNGADVTLKVANNHYTISNITADTSLEVEFERITYTLSITATGSGTVSYNDVATRGKTNTFNVVESSFLTMTITADEGYRIKSLKVNSVDVTSSIKDGKYTISSVTSNTTVEVVFEAIPNFTISILATGNGNVGYEGTVIRNQSQSYSVREGSSVTISFSPDKGYRVASVKVNKTDMTGQVVDGQLTISNISSNTSIEVEFEAIPPTTYTLTVKVGDNGSVTYDGTPIRNKSNTFTVVEGTYVTIMLTPDKGYCVKSVKLNNEDVKSNVENNQYTISGIASNTSIEVEFEEIICTLSIKSIGNGFTVYDETTIRRQTSTFNLSYGADAVVSFTPDEGYRIKSVKVNETDVTSKVANNQYTISNITTDTSLEVEFERITYSLTISATGNGSVIYNETTVRGKSTTFTLIEGTDAIVTFAPDEGYRIKNVKLNNNDITSSITGLQYTITNISANATLEVIFEAIPTYTVNIESSGNGRVTYGNVGVRNQSREFTIKEGNAISILFSADNGNRLASVMVNNQEMIGQVVNNHLTIENITADTNIEVTFEAIPITTYSFSIKSIGEGVVTYEGTAISKQSKVFTIAEGTNAVVVITPNEGYRIKSVTLNGTDVTSGVVNYMYSTKIESNTTLEVEFMEDVMEFAIDNVNYNVVSYSEKTIKLASGNYGTTLTVPATCSANDRQWTVIGIEADALSGNTDLAAIIWNPEVTFNGSVSNPNLLLYVKDKKYAGNVKNVIVNGEADDIVLQDAEGGNNFYCPQAFTAKSITYEHNYSMKSGYNTCQGWETLVLPFDVTQIRRQGGTELVPHNVWTVGSSQRPFWLYSLTELGWKKESAIAANTPYIICMPNNENYDAKYNISGVVQFIGTNVQVKASDNLNVGMNGNKKLVPNYQNQQANATIYALNVNNQWCQNTSTEVEGSAFISALRPIRPFEAYLSVSGAEAARRAIPIFEEGESTGIIALPLREDITDDTWYTIDGRKLFEKPAEKGVYLNGGKKVMVK